MNKTRYLRKCVLDHVFGRVSYSFPANVYIALFSADPTDLGTQTAELTEGGYSRVEISALMSDAALGTGVITNSAEITFGPATEDWSEITHVGIIDASTAGNMLYHMPAVTSRIVVDEDDFRIRIGQITIEEK